MNDCYMCGKSPTLAWYSFWYDGCMREICCMACRQDVFDLAAKNPDKTYSHTLPSEGLIA